LTLSLSPESHEDAPADELEDFKGNAEAPFAVVAKETEAPVYNFSFAKNVRSKWSDICELMEWVDDADAPIAYENFRVAEDPEGLVSTIQTKLLEEGATLPRHGVDGLFGPETKAALKSVMNPAPDLNPEALISDEDSKAVDAIIYEDGTPDVEPPAREITREEADKIQTDAMNATPKAMERVRGVIPEMWKNDFIGASDEDYIEAQSRLMGLREELVVEEPRLAPLNAFATEMIALVEQNFQEVDLSKIQSVEGLMDQVQNLSLNLKEEVTVLAEKHKLSESDIDPTMDLFAEDSLNMEVLLTFALAIIAEVAISFVQTFGKDEDELDRIATMLGDELFGETGLLAMDEGGREEPEEELIEGWDELVERGAVVRGAIDLVSEGEILTFDLDSMTFSVGEKEAHLELPMGAKLNSVEAQSNGRFKISARTKYGNLKRSLTKEQIVDLIGDLKSGEPDEKIELSTGIYLHMSGEVV